MNSERPPPEKPDSPADSSAEREGEVRRDIGPLSDYFEEGGPVYYPTDPKKFLEQLEVPRDPEKEIDAGHERERVGKQRETLDGLIAKENEKENALGAARQDLGIGTSPSDTLKKLEEAREDLREDAEKLDLAEEFNDVLDSFSSLSREDLEQVLHTGKTRKGEAVRNKRGEEIHFEVAKQLARLAASGMRRITWGQLATIMEVADAVLRDAVSAVKGVLGFRRSEGTPDT